MHSAGSEKWPMVDVIVAVRNEAALIAGKLQELDAIEYPPDRLRITIVDGRSSDGTVAAINAHAGADRRWQRLMTDLASKTAQLNEALQRTTHPGSSSRMPTLAFRPARSRGCSTKFSAIPASV